MQLSRRSFLTYTAGGALALVLVDPVTGARQVLAAGLPGGTLQAGSIRQFVTPLLVPPTMPRTRRSGPGGPVDHYTVSVRQFAQQVLPAEHPATTVWGYGPAAGGVGRALHHAPSMTIEAEHGVPVRIRWVNELVDADGGYLPHLLPVDPTLHWANPERRPGPDGVHRTDVRPDLTGLTYVPPGELTDPQSQYTTYQGPVPMVVHLHGAAGMGDESDGYPEAWVLPDAVDIPADHARHGTWYPFFESKSRQLLGTGWGRGAHVAAYPNANRDSTLWFHDHSLGITRLNVYAGPAGFYLLRGGEHGEDTVVDARTGRPAVLPSTRGRGAQGRGQQGTYEVPLAVQDRSFDVDGSLFYPDTRAFFDGYVGPFVPDSPIAPVWNPEFFGNALIVNGRTWPFLEVEQRRYRFRFLNGCGSRFLILDLSGILGVRAHQIGNDGGFLAAPHDLADDEMQLLLGPAERADVIVDLTDVPVGEHVVGNVGPDEPYGGGVPGLDFEPADPATTGRVLALRVGRARGTDLSTPAEHLVLPALPPPGAQVRVRRLALLEHMHEIGDHEVEEGEAPAAALLGVLEGDPTVRAEAHALTWADPVTENPDVGDTEIWELYNLTADAHPVHVHETPFEVLERRGISVEEAEYVVGVGEPLGPLPAGDRGLKDTVVSYPGTVTRIRMTFRNAGQFVWHCHVLEHEDNEMMRPYRVGPVQGGQPADGPHHHG